MKKMKGKQKNAEKAYKGSDANQRSPGEDPINFFSLFNRSLRDSVQPMCSSRSLRPCNVGDLDNSNITSSGKREEDQGEDDKRVQANGEEDS